jgi:hypothetical protein
MNKIGDAHKTYWNKKYGTDLSEEDHREIWTNLGGFYSIFAGIAERMDEASIPTSGSSGCVG